MRAAGEGSRGRGCWNCCFSIDELAADPWRRTLQWGCAMRPCSGVAGSGCGRVPRKVIGLSESDLLAFALRWNLRRCRGAWGVGRCECGCHAVIDVPLRHLLTSDHAGATERQRCTAGVSCEGPRASSHEHVTQAEDSQFRGILRSPAF